MEPTEFNKVSWVINLSRNEVLRAICGGPRSSFDGSEPGRVPRLSALGILGLRRSLRSSASRLSTSPTTAKQRDSLVPTSMSHACFLFIGKLFIGGGQLHRHGDGPHPRRFVMQLHV